MKHLALCLLLAAPSVALADDVAAPAPTDVGEAVDAAETSEPSVDDEADEATPHDPTTPADDGAATDAPPTPPEPEAPAADAPVVDEAATPTDTSVDPDAFSLEKDVVPWVTVVVGALAIVGAGALIGFGALPFYAIWDLEQKASAIDGSTPADVERARLLQQSIGLRRKDWNMFGLPMVTSGAVILVAGGVFLVGGIVSGMGLMDGAE